MGSCVEHPTPPLTWSQRACIILSTRNRNVPILNEIEMSPCGASLLTEKQHVEPVGAVENSSCEFSKERWARSARPRLRQGPSASSLARAGERDDALLNLGVVTAPGMLGARVPATPRGDDRRQRGDCQCHRWLGKGGRNLGPPHQASTIADFQRAIRRLPDDDRAAHGHVAALPRHLQVPRGVADDPVVGEHAGLFQLEDTIEGGARRDSPMDVLGRRRRLRKARVVLEQVRRLQKRVRRRCIRKAQPAELLDQPVLVGAVIALYSAFRLRRARGDDLTVERRAHAAKLRPRHDARDLFLGVRWPHIDVFQSVYSAYGTPYRSIHRRKVS